MIAKMKRVGRRENSQGLFLSLGFPHALWGIEFTCDINDVVDGVAYLEYSVSHIARNMGRHIVVSEIGKPRTHRCARDLTDRLIPALVVRVGERKGNLKSGKSESIYHHPQITFARCDTNLLAFDTGQKLENRPSQSLVFHW